MAARSSSAIDEGGHPPSAQTARHDDPGNLVQLLHGFDTTGSGTQLDETNTGLPPSHLATEGANTRDGEKKVGDEDPDSHSSSQRVYSKDGSLFRNAALKEHIEDSFNNASSKKRQSSWMASLRVRDPITGGINLRLHSAEVSGASADPKLQLMGVAQEVRDKILRYVLISDRPIPLGFWMQLTTRSFHDVSDEHNAMQETRLVGCMIKTKDYQSELRDRTSVLRACKQACAEGRPVFYGENTWLKKDGENFEILRSESPKAKVAIWNPGRYGVRLDDLHLFSWENDGNGRICDMYVDMHSGAAGLTVATKPGAQYDRNGYPLNTGIQDVLLDCQKIYEAPSTAFRK
ncbi:hypothetical protein H2200_007218 [Cladophialophora chaetospira]|uniref:Uncharacterized protein n=1 Tax=Cladophialophora chaetospira TaxID=386627 RepID=A0AA39CHH8_9EURO|nr:hypothetical protein H2200_007218 [Cladophialophora chaetospira]